MNKQKTITLIILVLITTIAFSSCEQGTEPEIIKPGRRDYTWTVDSLNIPYFFLTDISGVSPNDIWAVGPGGDLDKTIWHYDGDKWECDRVFRPISPDAVFAIDDVVWIAGDDGLIWKRENEQWVFSAKFKLKGYKNIGFANIWGNRKNNIYAIGVALAENEDIYRQSVIAHYNGVKWKLLDTDGIKCSLTSIKIDPITKKTYVSGTRNEPFLPDTSKLFLLEGEKLTKISWEKKNAWDDVFIQATSHNLLFSMGETIKYLSNASFISLINIDIANYRGGFNGRSIKDIFVGMRDGIMHYNGKDFKYIYYFPNGMELWLGRTAIFEKEYFHIELSRNYIIHGKLK